LPAKAAGAVAAASEATFAIAVHEDVGNSGACLRDALRAIAIHGATEEVIANSAFAHSAIDPIPTGIPIAAGKRHKQEKILTTDRMPPDFQAHSSKTLETQ